MRADNLNAGIKWHVSIRERESEGKVCVWGGLDQAEMGVRR